MRGGEPLAHLNVTPVHNYHPTQRRNWTTAKLMAPISPANHALSGGRCKGPSPQSTIDIPKLVLLLAGDPGAFTPLGALALTGTMATAACQQTSQPD
jgi:hypothetical protein